MQAAVELAEREGTDEEPEDIWWVGFNQQYAHPVHSHPNWFLGNYGDEIPFAGGSDEEQQEAESQMEGQQEQEEGQQEERRREREWLRQLEEREARRKQREEQDQHQQQQQLAREADEEKKKKDAEARRASLASTAVTVCVHLCSITKMRSALWLLLLGRIQDKYGRVSMRGSTFSLLGSQAAEAAQLLPTFYILGPLV
ncbi:unnamed protein product [Vitrella brassicaformis CCMP3155]|uniref:Uncharacterized protein n=1 Tax=Vitrella brassicaformis (strain CCMP3155) TaxID=1169540 RepID=A0A0G4EPH7_VITBC|nr:unnamed protein product [Vitrella brassicaformis CCMP3155]|eukprot:CEL99732.1 unnamed protein product [Vitrella brassicaformis CCMP3155]